MNPQGRHKPSFPNEQLLNGWGPVAVSFGQSHDGQEPVGGSPEFTAWPPFEFTEAADLVATDPEYRRRYLIAVERLRRG